MTQRIFSREELESMGVPEDLATKDKPREGFAVQLNREWIGETRWGNLYSLMFRAPDDGKAYEVTYESPATEMQEDLDPFDGDREVRADEVEPHVALTVYWLKPDEGREPAVPPEVVEEVLRDYIARLDYDIHKRIESDEMTGENTYPQEAADFSSGLEAAIRSYLL